MRKHHLLLLAMIVVTLVLLIPGSAFAATTWYVNGAIGSDANGGTSWNDAYKDLQSALTAAQAGDEIWVAASSYKPTSGSDRLASFVLPAGVSLYGGFIGNETARAERDWEANVTTLSGEIGNQDITTDNSYQVVRCISHNSQPTPTAVLDGFTVTGGRADLSLSYPDPRNYGGGMCNVNSSPIVRNVVFLNNYAGYGGGGGMANYPSSSPTLTNVTFLGNEARYDGGGMYNRDRSSPTLVDVVFSGNVLTFGDSGGAGMFNYNLCAPTLTRVSFVDNYVPGNASGGGVYAAYQCALTLTDVSFTDNSAPSGAGMRLHDQVSAVLQGVRFVENLSKAAALYASGASTLSITDAVFRGNSTTGSFGGAMRVSGSSATVTNTVFANNTVAAAGSPSPPSYGGAVYNDSSSLMFTNVSFAGNSAGWYGGALYNSTSSASATLVNCILWGNSATYGGDEIYEYASNSTVSYSFVHGGWTGAGLNNIGGDSLDDPLFVDAANGDLHLTAGSPAIDSATSAGAPDTDLDGTVRPQGDSHDMGAYEYVANSSPTDITLSNSSVPENEPIDTVVETLAAVDPDYPDSHSFALVPGYGDIDNASFNISGSDLRASEPFDYETKNSFSIRVEVTDQGGLTYEKQFTITVTDANDAPVITSNGGGAAATARVDEGETEVTRVKATDQDDDILTYGILGGDDAAFFTIDPSTGLLSFGESPAYEHPQDADADNVYEVMVQATDDGSPVLTDTQTIDVRVGNVRYFLLRYQAGEGGSISGRNTQSIRYRADGTAVTAVPDAGYQFLQWSDGLTTAARTDTDVSANLSVKAEFEVIPVPPPHVDRWSDVTDAEWVSSYGVTANQVWTVAKGFSDGTYRPTRPVTRAQFAKMVTGGFALGTFSPSEPSFPDVPVSHELFSWIESAAKAKVVLGHADGLFRPAWNISRQHVNTILGRYLSMQELGAEGYIRGHLGAYASVEAWFAAEGSAVLAPFADTGSLSPAHKAYTAYLVDRGVVQGVQHGGNLYLMPLSNVTRAQAAVLVLRAAGEL